MQPFIRTDRLHLLKPNLKYAQQLFDCVIANREHLQPYLSWVANVTLKDEESYIKNSIASWESKSAYNYLIFLHDNNELIGTIGSVELVKNSCEIGYWIAKNYAGKGLASEAIRAYEKELLANGINKFSLKIDVKNSASIALAKKFNYSLSDSYSSEDNSLQFVKQVKK